MDLRETLRRQLADREDVLFAFLFGSQAAGRARPDSDWNLAVFLSGEAGSRAHFDARRCLSADLEELGVVDVVVLNDAPALIAHRALQGQEIWMRDRVAYVRFFVRTISMSEDERHWRSIHAKARAERLREGRFGRP